MEEVPRASQLQHVREVEHQVMQLAKTYLEMHHDEVRPKNLELAAMVVVQTMEALTHGAVIHRPDLLEMDELQEEITEIIVRYLVADPVEKGRRTKS